MKIVFTLCSNNYLAQAKALGDSIRQYSPDYTFFIGLIDQPDGSINYEKEIGHAIIPVANIGIPAFDELWKKYTIIEFNTCVKPFYFEYFCRLYPGLAYIHYLDPDILVFSDLKGAELELTGTEKILLTPHILSPLPLDGKTPTENMFLNFGIYNLGYLGLKDPGTLAPLISWWKERTYHLGFSRPEDGLFVDQLWMNFTHLYFNDVKISRHPGLNMAPWNLHERRLSEVNGKFMVNDNYPLVFFHFSNYKFSEPSVISGYYTRFGFSDRPDLEKIYEIYQQQITANNIERLSAVKCRYMALREEYYDDIFRKELESSRMKQITHRLKKVLSPKLVRILNALRS